MIGKNSMKHHYVKKKIFTVTMEDITDADGSHSKRICKDFETKNLGESHDLYFQSIKLLLVDLFEIYVS